MARAIASNMRGTAASSSGPRTIGSFQTISAPTAESVVHRASSPSRPRFDAVAPRP
jgi:hypothetical protein